MIVQRDQRRRVWRRRTSAFTFSQIAVPAGSKGAITQLLLWPANQILQAGYRLRFVGAYGLISDTGVTGFLTSLGGNLLVQDAATNARFTWPLQSGGILGAYSIVRSDETPWFYAEDFSEGSGQFVAGYNIMLNCRVANSDVAAHNAFLYISTLVETELLALDASGG